MNYLSNTTYLKIKIDNKWFVLDRFRIAYKKVFGKKVRVYAVWASYYD